MTNNEAPTQIEASLRAHLDGAILECELHLALDPPDFTFAKVALADFEVKIADLHSRVSTRLGKVASNETRTDLLRAWITAKSGLLQKYRVHYAALEAGDPTFPTPSRIRDSKVAVIKERIKTVAARVRAAIQSEVDLVAEQVSQAGFEMQKHVYSQHIASLEPARLDITKSIPDLYKEVVELDPGKAGTFSTEESTLVEELDKLYRTAMQKIHSAPMHSETFPNIGPPAGSSTLNGSLLNTSGASASSSVQRSALRVQVKVPKFNGSPGDYPRWKKELQQDFFPGLSDSSCIRVMAENSPNPDLVREFQLVKEAWKHMDLLYANPKVVSRKLIPGFLDTRSLAGSNKYEELASLHKKIRTMLITLKTVGQEHELTSSSATVEKAADLLPQKFKLEFNREVTKATVASGVEEITPGEKFKLLEDYLEENYKLFVRSGLVDPAFGEGSSTYSSDSTNTNSGPAESRRKRGKGGGRSSPGLHNIQSRPSSGATHYKSGGGRGSSQREPNPAEQKAIAAEWKKWGACPGCGKTDAGHMFYNRKKDSYHASDLLGNCPEWLKKSTDERARELVANKWCYKCTSWKHHQLKCEKKADWWKCRVKDPVTGKSCDEFHSVHVHGTTVTLCLMDALKIDRNTWQPGEGDNLDDEEFMVMMRQDVMLPVVATDLVGKYGKVAASVLLDSGSNCTVVTNELATRLGLKGRKVVQDVRVVASGPTPMEITYYSYTFHTFTGKKKMILLGLDSISYSPGNYSVEAAYKVFPHIKRGTLEKPDGPIDMIIGTDACDLLPGGGERENLVNNLRVMTIPFSPGTVLLGSHKDIVFKNSSMSRAAYSVTRGEREPAASYHPTCNNFRGPTDLLEMQDVVQEMEMMPYNLPRRCQSCQTCQTCTFQEEGMTVEEKSQLLKMRDNIWHDPERNKIIVSYPHKDGSDITKFVDNRQQAMKRCESLINSLKKKEQYTLYSKLMKEYEDRGVLEEVSLEDIEKYKAKGGPVHYVAHHGVENPASKTTPLRIVVDSSIKNNNTGPRLTDLYCKGPNYINNLYNVLTQWRSFEACGVYDWSKAYHSMETTEKEFFMRLVVWKMEDGKWKIMGHKVVGMGDNSAAVFLELAKEIAAKLGEKIDPQLAFQLVPMSYVDDGLLGGKPEDIERMRGDVYVDSEGVLRFTGTLAQMAALIGMRAKNFCVSGETDERCLEKQGKVLGLVWHPVQDTISFKLSANITPRRGALRVGPDLTPEDADNLDSVVFTKRICLQIAAFNFDPLGLISAFIMKLKIALKELVEKEYSWDQPLEDSLQLKWRGLLREVLLTDEIHFPRSVYCRQRIGRPELIVYADGSTVAFGSIIYIRWEIGPGEFTAFLVTSKGRVTPSKGLTAPRSEIQGLVLATRLTTKVIKYHDIKPKRVSLITDSECSVAACDVNASSLATFFANRVLEIRENMKSWGSCLPGLQPTDELTDSAIKSLGDTEVQVDLISHTPGELNPADWPTRPDTAWENLRPGTVWQRGPDYLTVPRTTWPLTRNSVAEIPAAERRKKFFNMENIKDLNHFLQINGLTALDGPEGKKFYVPGGILAKTAELMEYTKSFIKAKMLVSRLIALFKNERELASSDGTPVRYQEQAEWLMQLASQYELWVDIIKKDTKDRSSSESFPMFSREGVHRYRGRLDAEDMMRHTGHESLVLLTYKCRLAYLVMRAAHYEDHRSSPGDALLRSRRRGYWIIRGRTLAREVVKHCSWCKLYKAPFWGCSKQKMADLPRQVFNVPTRPFTNICLDFMGYVNVFDQVKRRVSTKAYPVVFCCMNTGAVHLVLAAGYSTSDFLTAWRTFTSIRGVPRYVHTDMGTQLTSASKKFEDQGDEVRELPQYKWKEIIKVTNPQGTEWRHCPTQSQWRNGRAERMIQSLKATLKHMYKGGKLTFAEFSCLLSMSASVINDRPLGVRHHGGAEGGLCVLTPNLLLQGGRVCAGSGHLGDFRSDMGRVEARMKIVEESFRAWWSVWYDTVWESLVPFKKWKTSHRNIKVGDVVLVKYEANHKDPTFRRGRVTAVYPDKYGNVRDTTVSTQPKANKMKPDAKLRRPVEQDLPVQRLVVLLPVEEIEKLEPADEKLHICEQELRVPDVLEATRSPTASPRDSLINHTTLFDTKETPRPPREDGPGVPPAPSVELHLLGAHVPNRDSSYLDFRPPEVDPRDLPLVLHSLAVHVHSHQSSHPAPECWRCQWRDQFYYLWEN